MIRVGVLRGGTGVRYDESLASGAFVLRNLPRDRYEPVDVFIDQSGVWHIGGKPASYEKVRQRVDVVWNSLHGFYGEDGKLQQQLDVLGIPYTGSGPLASAITMNKKLEKERLAAIGVEASRGVYIERWGNGDRDETVASVVADISRKFSPPWVVQPIAKSRADGAAHCQTREELSSALSQMFDFEIPTLVEESVVGRASSVIVLRGFRGQNLYTFPALPLDDSAVRMQTEESQIMQDMARGIHANLSLGHFSRVEAIITPKGKVYITNIETVPNTNIGSDMHRALESTGVSFKEFADHLIALSLKKS